MKKMLKTDKADKRIGASLRNVNLVFLRVVLSQELLSSLELRI